MKKLLLALLLFSTSAFADSNPADVVAVATVTALRAGTFTSYAHIRLEGWATLGDGGGGLLTLIPTDTTSSDNSCTIFVDGAGNRFYRDWSTGKPLLARWCGAIPGTGTTPGSWPDETTALTAALNVAAGGKVVLDVGPYKVTGDLDSLTSANNIDFVGATPAMFNLCKPWLAVSIPTTCAIDPNAGSSYTQTPPAWVLSAYTVLYTSYSGTFGHADSVSAYGYGYKLRHLANVVMWASSAGTAQMAFQQACQNTTIEDSTFVLYTFIGGILRGGGDNCNFYRTAWLDNGWNTAESGVLTVNPTYGSGVAVLWASTGSQSATEYQTYFGIGSPRINYTQSGMSDTYVWVRNDTLNNKSGYRALQLTGAAGDLRFLRFQAVTGVLTYQASAIFDQSHIETESMEGTSHSSNTDLYAFLNYDGQVRSTGGWQGLGAQVHNGPFASSPWYWVFNGGSGTYTSSTVSPPSYIDLKTQYPGTSGKPWYGGRMFEICRNSAAGSAGNENFIWNSVLPDGPGFHGSLFVSVSLQSNKTVYRAQPFELYWTNNSGSYASSNQSLASALSGGAGNYNVTFAPTTTGNGTSTSLSGQNLVVNITYDGASWALNTPVCVDAVLSGGSVQSN